MPGKLAVRARYQPYVVPEENTVILHDEIASLILRGSAVTLIAPYLDGTHTLDTLTEALQHVLPQDTIVTVVTHMIHDGIVEVTDG